MIPATPSHASALAEIHAASFPPAEHWGEDAFFLQLRLPTTIGFIDPAGGLVLARVAADEAEILTIAVIPAARRTGLGRRLLEAAARAAAGAGAIKLFLEVAETNHQARALYDSAGFTTVARRPRYYPGGTDALVMQRDITSAATEPA